MQHRFHLKKNYLINKKTLRNRINFLKLFKKAPDNFLTSFQDLFGGLIDRFTPDSNGSKELTKTNSASPFVKN